jgi:hypothetical protein
VPADVIDHIIDALLLKQRHEARHEDIRSPGFATTTAASQNAGGVADGHNAGDHPCASETSRSTSPPEADT